MSTDQTSNLGLPFVMPAQAQKHVTVNESLLRLDALVQARVESRSVASQPGAPTDGRLWILPPGKTGPEWGGYADGALAYYRDGYWEPLSPREGWRFWVADEDVFVRYTGSAWTADEAVGGLNGGPLAGLRNKILNGDFRIWQRGTSVAVAASGDFSGADRWRVGYDGSGATRTLSRQAFAPGQTDVPGEPEFFHRFEQSAAGSGGSINRLLTRIENVRTLAGRRATLSFHAKADASRTLGLHVAQRFGSGGSSEVSIEGAPASVSLTTAWARFEIGFDIPSISGKTVGADSFLQIDFRMPVDETFAIDLANIQLEAGLVATPFEERPLGLELALCQRYYEAGDGLGALWAGSAVNGSTYYVGTTFRVEKRASPTVLLTNASASGFGTTPGTPAASVVGFIEGRAATSTVNAGYFRSAWAASAEL